MSTCRHFSTSESRLWRFSGAQPELTTHPGLARNLPSRSGERLVRPRRAARTFVLGCAVMVLLLVPAGCLKKSQERRFELKGKVVSVDPKSGQVTIAHEAIPGYMPAMTMPYELKDDLALRVAKPGDDISAVLIVSGGKAWLQDAVVVEQTPDNSAGSKKPAVHFPEPGEPVPEFSLINQDGKKVRIRDFRGGPLVLTFIYTRCPLPNYCPLMSANFVELDKELRDDSRLSSKTHLLSVTIDPEFDTPSVMRGYGLEYIKQAGETGFERWQFASGSDEEIKSIAKYFGLEYWQESGQIIHSLVTSVIDPNGNIAKVFVGNDWKAPQVMGVLQSLKLD